MSYLRPWLGSTAPVTLVVRVATDARESRRDELEHRTWDVRPRTAKPKLSVGEDPDESLDKPSESFAWTWMLEESLLALVAFS
jgi:hypothetical protein